MGLPDNWPAELNSIWNTHINMCIVYEQGVHSTGELVENKKKNIKRERKNVQYQFQCVIHQAIGLMYSRLSSYLALCPLRAFPFSLS